MKVSQKTSCIWIYLWLLDKITKIDLESGLGSVLGGRPIKYDELKDFGDRKTLIRIFKKLDTEGYIVSQRTPYGKIIWVTKAKKSFGKKIERSPESGTSRSGESGTSISGNLVHLVRESGTSNKTLQLDNKPPSGVGAAAPSNLLAKGSCFGDPGVDRLWNLGQELGFNTTNKQKQRQTIWRVIRKIGVERAEKAAKYAVEVRDDHFAPQIFSWLDFEQKYEKLKHHHNHNAN